MLNDILGLSHVSDTFITRGALRGNRFELSGSKKDIGGLVAIHADVLPHADLPMLQVVSAF
jgi:hypothetical protein